MVIFCFSANHVIHVSIVFFFFSSMISSTELFSRLHSAGFIAFVRTRCEWMHSERGGDTPRERAGLKEVGCVKFGG